MLTQPPKLPPRPPVLISRRALLRSNLMLRIVIVLQALTLILSAWKRRRDDNRIEAEADRTVKAVDAALAKMHELEAADDELKRVCAPDKR